EFSNLLSMSVGTLAVITINSSLVLILRSYKYLTNKLEARFRMSALDKVPSNNNFLSPLGFHFSVRKLPNVNFFVQRVRIPSISLPPADTPNPFVKIPYSGDH